MQEAPRRLTLNVLGELEQDGRDSVFLVRTLRVCETGAGLIFTVGDPSGEAFSVLVPYGGHAHRWFDAVISPHGILAPTG